MEQGELTHFSPNTRCYKLQTIFNRLDKIHLTCYFNTNVNFAETKEILRHEKDTKLTLVKIEIILKVSGVKDNKTSIHVLKLSNY